MSIQVFYGATPVEQKWVTFSDGASNVKLEMPRFIKSSVVFNITYIADEPVDKALWSILMVNDAIRLSSPESPRRLNLMYLPHGRADRPFDHGMPFPLQVFMDTIVDLNFDSITLCDPHSSYYMCYKPHHKINVLHQRQCFYETIGCHLPLDESFVIVSPDHGALDKSQSIYKFMSDFGHKVEYLTCDKERDPKTGKILSIKVPESDLNGKRCIIADDICDGGGTFLPIAKKLKDNGAEMVDLYVTHGIFSKGLDLFKDDIDNIHVFQVVSNYVNKLDILKFNERS